ncbi:MAG: group III truncated hemoglobin [Sphingomonadales bacterium]|nr:MAG: group III truncated hemoglobin [Sphingomonadales bacterium]
MNSASETIDDPGLERLVTEFYSRVRRDGELGPIFNDAVDDWPEHFGKLTDFWSSVMLTTGRYKGNPVAAHRRHAGRITPELFDRWLAIWKQTTDELMVPGAASALQTKADRIAESLKLALFFKLPPRVAAS